MKSIFIAFILASWLVVVDTVIADESSGCSFLCSFFEPHFPQKDFSVSVGVKTWVNKWNLPTWYQADGDKSEQNLVMTFNSDTEIVFIPVLSVRAKNFFISGSYFPNTEYSFGEQSLDFPFSTSDNLFYYDETFPKGAEIGGGVAAVKIPAPVSISAERSELDINIGYYFHQSLVVTAGYKRIDRQFNLKSRLPNDFSFAFVHPETDEWVTVGIDDFKKAGAFSVEDEFDNKTDGLTLGVASVVPLGSRVGLYGGFGFGWLDTTIRDDEYNSNYYLGELGLLYFSSKLNNDIPLFINMASIYMGYRFQALNDDLPVGVDGTDSTEGFVLGVTLTF